MQDILYIWACMQIRGRWIFPHPCGMLLPAASTRIRKGDAYEQKEKAPFVAGPGGADIDRRGPVQPAPPPRRGGAAPAKQHCRYPRHHAGLAKTTPGGETGEVFVQDYTLTPNREAELVQEVCDWLKAARFRDPRFSTTEFGSGLLGGGTVYLIGVQPSDGDALSAVQILDDGRVAISGVFLYWLDEKDMDGLRAIFDHLNTIYD